MQGNESSDTQICDIEGSDGANSDADSADTDTTQEIWLSNTRGKWGHYQRVNMNWIQSISAGLQIKNERIDAISTLCKHDFQFWLGIFLVDSDQANRANK